MAYVGTVTATVVVTIAWISTILRCYTRFAIMGGLKIDDAFVVMANLAATIMPVMCWIEDFHGLGHPMATVPSHDVIIYLKAFWTSFVGFCLSIVLMKCSALLQCLRFILIGKMRLFCKVFIVLNLTMGIIGICVQMFSCTPIAGLWDLTITNRKCFDIKWLWYIGSGMITLTDFMVVAIPIWAVKDLQLPRRQKIALIVVFAVGGLACLASIIRFYTSVIVGLGRDVTLDGTYSAFWAPIEVNVGIMCVNIPPLKPLILKIAPVLLGEGENEQQLSNAESSMSGSTLQATRSRQQQHRDDIERGPVVSKKLVEPWDSIELGPVASRKLAEA